ncbi:hypothetical protein D3C87_1644080 [compost metagenome]
MVFNYNIVNLRSSDKIDLMLFVEFAVEVQLVPEIITFGPAPAWGSYKALRSQCSLPKRTSLW